MNKDIEITLLTKDQSSEIIHKFGEKCIISDFAILLGGCKYKNEKDFTCWWWTQTSDYDGDVYINNASVSWCEAGRRSVSIRPVMKYTDTYNIYANSIRSEDGYLEIEYGEYPQYVVSQELLTILENELISGRLKKTGKAYTTDSRLWNDERSIFKPREHYEYEYQGKKYVKVIYTDGHPCTLSNDKTYYDGNEAWLEVSPITWLVDEKLKLLVSKTLLASGVRFCNNREYEGNFKDTEMYMFLNEYFRKDMIPSMQNEKEQEVIRVKKRNPFNLKFDKVTEEEIIKGAILSNVPVFLHGPSSEGKSARVKQIDPNCEIIYLRNATPESLNGKSVYNQSTGEMIDLRPTWLKKLKVKCDQEPDKLHIVFFDELTNALPSIQGMAFNIILDREVNGIWKLPKNARIVASGNEMSDSLAANQLAEPLFNRFAHVYIKTTVHDWLKWASLNNIHPAIYTYIAYKKEKALRSKYDGKTPNADPRKWEMASKVLYQTGNPKMLRSLVGEDITREFVAFCNEEIITLDDVIKGNYTKEDVISLNTAKRYATTMGLTSVDETNVEVVRNFTTKLGSEYRAIFDTLWIHNDESRLEKIAELNQTIDSSEELNINLYDCDSMEMTLLTKEEIMSLDVLRKYGATIGITDLAISTGADLFVNLDTAIDKITKLSTSYYYTKTPETNYVTIVDSTGNFQEDYADSSDDVIRPVLLLPQGIFLHIFKNKVEGYNGTYEVEFGEYPQFVPYYNMQERLTNALHSGRLRKTNYEYDFDSCKYEEYEYENEQYIYVDGIFCEGCAELSDAKMYENYEGIWLKVAPVRWLIDEENQRLISKYGLLSGIEFEICSIEYTGNFEETNMYKFMNEYMLKDILHSCKLEEKVKKKIR